MNYNAARNDTRISLNAILGLDILRNIKPLDDQMKNPAEESENSEYIIENVPIIDLGKNVSSELKDVLKSAGEHARSDSLDEIRIQHLFIALVEYPDIKNNLELEESTINELRDSTRKSFVSGEITPEGLRRIDMKLSQEVGSLLEDSLNASMKASSNLIAPTDVLVTLLEKSISEISAVLENTGIKLKKALDNLKNENI